MKKLINKKLTNIYIYIYISNNIQEGRLLTNNKLISLFQTIKNGVLLNNSCFFSGGAYV